MNPMVRRGRRAIRRSWGLRSAVTLSLVAPALVAGCISTDLDRPSPTPPVGPPTGIVTVVNRSAQTISPAPGALIPACGRTSYDAQDLAQIRQSLADWVAGEDPEWPVVTVGRLDASILPSSGDGWILLVT